MCNNSLGVLKLKMVAHKKRADATKTPSSHHATAPPLRKHQPGQESDGQTRSWCLDKAVLAQGGGG